MKFENFDKRTLFIYFLITIIILILFKNEVLINFFLNVINSYIKPFFEFENTWYNCIAILFISGLFIYLIMRYGILNLFNKPITYSILLFLNLLFLESIHLDYFDLFVLFSFNNIEINILTFILLAINIYFIYNSYFKFTEENSSKNSNEKYKDQLFLGTKAEDFLNLLLNKVDESIFGINGSWGVGKTFFYKIIKQKLINSGIKEEQIIEINVWKYDSSEKIIKSFLSAIEVVLLNNDINIYKEFERYKKALFGLNPTIKTPFIDLTFRDDNKTPEELLVEINNIISRKDIKFYVFVDDLDRLKPDEVFEVIKFLRIIGQFNSFKYVVTYDKEYLIESLKSLNIPFSEKFLDKIIEYEIQLNRLNSEEVFRLLQSYFNSKFPNASKSSLFTIIDDKNIYEFFFESFNVYRDIELFIKEFEYFFEKYSDDLDLKTFALIVSLKINFPSIYSLILKHRAKYFYIKQDTQSLLGYLKMIENSKSITKDNYSKSILKKEIDDILFDEIKRELCNKLLDNIFTLNILKTQLIFNSNNFNSYFNLSDERIYKNEIEMMLIDNSLLDNYNNDKIISIYYYLFGYISDFHLNNEPNLYETEDETEDERDISVINLLMKILNKSLDFKKLNLFDKIKIFSTNENVGLSILFNRLFEDFIISYIKNYSFNNNIKFLVDKVDNDRNVFSDHFKNKVLYNYYLTHFSVIKEINISQMNNLKTNFGNELQDVFIDILVNNFEASLKLILNEKYDNGKVLYGIGIDRRSKKIVDIVFNNDNFKIKEFIHRSKLDDHVYNNFKEKIEAFELFFQAYINSDEDFIHFHVGELDDSYDLPF